MIRVDLMSVLKIKLLLANSLYILIMIQLISVISFSYFVHDSAVLAVCSECNDLRFGLVFLNDLLFFFLPPIISQLACVDRAFHVMSAFMIR